MSFKMNKSTEKCVLCGKPASSSKNDDSYLDGFCDLCIMSMKKEQQKKSKIESPYDEIFNKITAQLEKIETAVSLTLDKIESASTSTSSSPSKKSSEPKIIKPNKKDAAPSPKQKDDAYGSHYTSIQTNIDQPKSNDDKKNNANAKPKKIRKSKFMPTVSPA